MQKIRIETDHCGGNLQVLSKEGSVYNVAPDLRDTEGYWFYFNFRVCGAAEHTLKFDFGRRAVHPFGPAVSFDGENWAFMPERAVSDEASFTFSFEKGEDTVYFAFAFPYQVKRLKKFLESNTVFRRETLCTSEKGRKVPLLIDGDGPLTVAFSCRHHSCESVASYVLEGVLSAFAESAALRRRFTLYVLPFADIDGVEEGDQGKNRSPHDFNRDYTDSPIYKAVAAWMKLLGNIRPVAALDLHDPFMWGWANDHTCITYPRGGGAELDRFSQCLQKATAVSSIRHDPQYDLKWGAEWNCAEEARRFSQ